MRHKTLNVGNNRSISFSLLWSTTLQEILKILSVVQASCQVCAALYMPSTKKRVNGLRLFRFHFHSKTATSHYSVLSSPTSIANNIYVGTYYSATTLAT